jgi:hypothetical protein
VPEIPIQSIRGLTHAEVRNEYVLHGALSSLDGKTGKREDGKTRKREDGKTRRREDEKTGKRENGKTGRQSECSWLLTPDF